MDSTSEELYYQKIKEFVLDEDKIVTCTSLVNDLNITIHNAKVILSKFLEDYQHVKPNELGATFMLTGVLKHTNKLCVTFCQAHEINEKKALFSEVLSQFIYSIQKKKTIEIDHISLVDSKYTNSAQNLSDLGYITGKNCSKREPKKATKVEIVNEPAPGPSRKINGFFSKGATSVNAVKSVDKTETTKTPDTKKTANPQSKTNVKGKTGGLTSFLKATPSKPNDINKENKKEKINVETLKTEPPKTVRISENKPNNHDLEELMIVEETSKDYGKVEAGTTDKKRKKTTKNEQPSKKRKRIQQVSDSESDDMFGDVSDSEKVEKSDQEEPPAKIEVKKPPPVITPGKKRKAVDRTYQDEEGFIVTTTEYVYETASEDEKTIEPPPTPVAKKTTKPSNSTDSETEANKEAKKKGKPGKKKVASGKQPSIMNFFNKK